MTVPRVVHSRFRASLAATVTALAIVTSCTTGTASSPSPPSSTSSGRALGKTALIAYAANRGSDFVILSAAGIESESVRAGNAVQIFDDRAGDGDEACSARHSRLPSQSRTAAFSIVSLCTPGFLVSWAPRHACLAADDECSAGPG
jgi:hypothetical protein